MCGRYASTRSARDVAALFDADDTTADEPLRPRYNVAPTDRVPVVRRSRRAGRRVVAGMRWGLVPSWSPGRPSGPPLINARAESVTSRPAFRAAFARRRCLVPADGWYEWVRGEDGGKQPVYVTSRDGSGLAFAAVWEVSGAADGADGAQTAAGAGGAVGAAGGAGWPAFSCAVVTTAAVGRLRAVHDRMPLLVPPSQWAAWLGEQAGVDVRALLEPAPVGLVDDLRWWPVGPAVGNVRNDGPGLCLPVDAPREAPIVMDGTLF